MGEKSPRKSQEGKENKDGKEDKDKKEKKSGKKQAALTPEQVLTKMRPQILKNIEKTSPKISKNAEEELIDQVFNDVTFFGCPNGKKIGTIQEIKAEAKAFIDNNMPTVEMIKQKPEEFVAETKKGHEADFLTHLQSENRAFPIKTAKNPNAEEDEIHPKEKKEIETSVKKAHGTNFTSSLMATLNIISLFADASGEGRVKMAHDGANLDRIARILDKNGVSYVRYIRSLLIAYSKFVLKDKSRSALGKSLQMLFGTTTRIREPSVQHMLSCLMRAEILVEMDPQDEQELGEFIMIAAKDNIQYALTNFVALLNKQSPITEQALDSIVKSKDGTWAFLEQGTGAAGNVKYFDVFTTKSYELEDPFDGPPLYQHLGFDLNIEQDQDMDEADESRDFRRRFAQIKLPTVFAVQIEEELNKKRRFEEPDVSSDSDASSEDEQDPLAGIKPSFFGGFGTLFLNHPPAVKKTLDKKLNEPPGKDEFKDAEEGFYWNEEKQKDTYWIKKPGGKKGQPEWEEFSTGPDGADEDEPKNDEEKEFEEWKAQQRASGTTTGGNNNIEDAIQDLLKTGGVEEKGKKASAATAAATGGKEVNGAKADTYREDADSTKYTLPCQTFEFVPFIFWTAVLVAKAAVSATTEFLNPFLYRCVRFFVNFRMDQMRTTAPQIQTEPDPPRELLWGVHLKSTVTAFKTRAAETKPEHTLQDMTILVMGGLFEKTAFMRMADEAAQKNYKAPNKTEILWPKGFLQKDRTLQTLKLCCERAQMNRSKHYLWFGFKDEERFKKLATALRPLRAEVEGKSSAIGEDPQAGDQELVKKLLEQFYFDEILKVLPYAATDIHQDGGQAAQLFHQEVAEKVRTGNDKNGTDKGGGKCRKNGKYGKDGKKGKGKGGKGKKGKGKKDEWEDNWDSHWNNWEQEDGHRKRTRDDDDADQRDPKKKNTRDEPSTTKTPFREMQERLINEVHKKTSIPLPKLNDAFEAKDYCPIHGAQLAKVPGRKNAQGKPQEWKCKKGDECWFSHKKTEDMLKKEVDWICPEASKNSHRGHRNHHRGHGDAQTYQTQPSGRYEKYNSNMPVVTQLHPEVIERLRQRYKEERSKRYQREKARLDSIFKDLEQFKTSPQAQKAMDEYEDMKLLHINLLNKRYEGHDSEFGTQRMNAWLWGQLAQWSNYLNEDKRGMLYGKRGLADGSWLKVRPIANEKLRNIATSPIGEHMALPGIPDILEGIHRCANPKYTDSHTQSKKDVTDSLTKNRKKKAGGKLAWKDVSALPKPHPGYQGTAFIPALGKIDLSQAYTQMGVNDPTQNQYQIWSPGEQEMKCGILNSLTFGNVHSVFGFVAAVSEPFSHFLNHILGIPSCVYIDDIIFLGAPECIHLYADCVRKLAALLGLAVAPEKTEVATYSETIEILGINFTPQEHRMVVDLPQKKKDLINEKINTMLALLANEASIKAQCDSIKPELERLSGLFIHALFSRKHKRSIPVTKYIYELIWLDEKEFRDKIFGKKSRKSLIMILKKINKTVQEEPPYEIAIFAATKGRKHVMTDASLDKSGKVALGGLTWLDEQDTCIGYSIHLQQHELPAAMRGQAIMSYELIALALAQRLFHRFLHQAHLICHCDNIGAVYAIVKGQCDSAYATATTFVLNDFCTEHYPTSYQFYAYVSTNWNASDACTRKDLEKDLIAAFAPRMEFSREQILAELHKMSEEISTAQQEFQLHMRKDEQGLQARNSKWRTWMQYTKYNRPDLHWEPDNYKHDHQVEWLKKNHPNVSWNEMQKCAMWLLDCDYKNPQHYMSTVGQRLRSLNALERENPHASAMMTSAFEKVKKLIVEASAQKAVPPNITRISELSTRHKKIFALWMQTGLRPASIVAIRDDMVETYENSNYVTLKAVYKKECLPITKKDISEIAKTLGATTYGPRRGLAIWCRLHACEKGITPNSTNANTKQRFEDYRAEVGQHMGWMPRSNMWLDEYATDAFQWIHTPFAIHPLTQHRFDMAAKARQNEAPAENGGRGKNTKDKLKEKQLIPGEKEFM
eukprot:g5060.t1